MSKTKNTRTTVGAATRPPRQTSKGPIETADRQEPANGTAAAGVGRAEPTGKLGDMIALLRRTDGALIAELTATTGWQAHSVRGAISGALKKKLGLTVISEKTEGGRRYRIVDGGAEVDA